MNHKNINRLFVSRLKKDFKEKLVLYEEILSK